MFSTRLIKGFFIILVVSICATVSLAFASSNTGFNSKGGEGSGSISGFVISNIEYVLNSDPTRLDQVKFTLDSPASHVKIKLITYTSSYYNCTVISGNNWGCSLSNPSVEVKDIDELRVIAVQ